MKQQAENFEHNQKISEQRTDTIKKAVAFRPMLPRETWQRGVKPRFSSDVKEVAVVKGGVVKDTTGKAYPAKLVTPVPKETEAVDVPDFRGRALRDKRNADALRVFALELHAKLVQKGETALTSITRMMGEDFRKAKPSTLQIKDFILSC